MENYKGLQSKLQNLKMLLKGASEVKQSMEALSRTLGEQYIESKAFQISADLAVNLKQLKQIFSGSDDIKFREFWVVPFQLKAIIVFIEDMTDQEIINKHIIEKLTKPYDLQMSGLAPTSIDDMVQTMLLTAAAVASETKMESVVGRILLGDAALFIDTIDTAIVVAARKVKARAISEPQTETEIRGPRDGFTEELRTNVTLIRRRLNNPNLVVQKQTIGVRSKTEIAIVYLRGIVNFELVHEAEKRLQKITIDIPSPSGVTGLFEDTPFSLFPTVLVTERPEKVVALLAEGKVGILVEGTPFCHIAPTTFADFFKAGDDYYEKWLPATLIRSTRYLMAILALTIPGLYIAITSFHPGLLPTPLALTIGTAREGVPFPAFIEAFIMEGLLEVMQEAGIRLPKLIGPAVSIVGGLVIGEAAVRAGLVSAPLVIVTSFTAIASFSLSNYRLSLAVRVLRVPLMILAAVLGMYGVMCGLIAIAIHLSILESFGEPYLAALVPKSSANLSDLKDSFVVLPVSKMPERPGYVEPQDGIRFKEVSDKSDDTN